MAPAIRYDDSEHVGKREYMRQWYADNKERVNAHRKELLKDTSRHAKKLACDAAWRRANPEKHRAASTRWAKENPERYRENMRVAQHKRRALLGDGISAEDWRSALALSGHKCQKCSSGDSLEIDHVIPLSRGGANSPDNLQVLCRSCNARKSYKTEDWRI